LWKLSYHFFCYNYLKFHLHGEEASLLRNQVSHLLNIFYVNKIMATHLNFFIFFKHQSLHIDCQIFHHVYSLKYRHTWKLINC
jgi:hypothetical protein